MFLSSRDVCRFSSLGRSTLYEYEKQGLFPPSLRLGGGRVAWLRSEVDAWGEAIKRGATKEELKTIVAELVENRRKEVK